MPDPHVVYIVTAIVVVGLIAWVGVVLTRPPSSLPGADTRVDPPPESVKPEKL